MKDYNPLEIEKKWQKIWEEEKTYSVEIDKEKTKYYVLIEFPYPSGEGLHVGHTRSYTAFDIVARKKRMDGFNVLFPIGWDAFGLPTENFAIKNKIHPRIVTERNIKRFRIQLKSLGYSFSWNREVNTTDPEYYKWTQWIFLKLFGKGLAYKAEIPINWCTSCKVGLANEEVVGGVCERCGGEIVRKVKSQWMLKITDYAEKLLNDLDTVDYLDKIKAQQRNWIGRSEGMEVDFATTGGYTLRVYTTRPDTLFGATYMVISPEHPMIDSLGSKLTNLNAILEYRSFAAKKSDFERTEIAKEKTGVRLEGITAINPVNGKQIPVWVSDYVLMSYGTGAIMAVPGHDARDWEFARKFNLPIIEVVAGGDVDKEAFEDIETGTMINSEFLNGLDVKAAKEKISGWLESRGLGTRKVNYKLRDWVFSRQRYWGEPIPIIHCDKCGYVPVPEDQLPVRLPDVEDYMTTDTGESPLANIREWVDTKCPKCGGPGKRETDTMPQWAGSSWYFLRYTDPHNDSAFAGKEALSYWTPVNWYNGGMEHTTLHLLYSRFWHKFLYDIGCVPTPEPYIKRTSHGMILGENNEKMSKSRGNVVVPDTVVNEYGADAFRVYMLFIGAFDQAIPWSQNGVKGCLRFLERVWKLKDIVIDGNSYSRELETPVHRTIKKVSEDIERMKFNTAIAAMMTLVNDIYAKGQITRSEFKTLLLLLNPVAPHMTEELWELMDFGGRLFGHSWPLWDESKTVEDMVELAVQLNGKIKDKIMLPSGLDKTQTEEMAMQDEKVIALTEGKTIVKVIGVPGKLINIVVK